jgi:hypothetical protein
VTVAEDDFRERILSSIREAEERLGTHPKDCGGCPGCPNLSDWGDALHLAGLRVTLRNYDALLARCREAP